MTEELPVVGACLPVEALAEYQTWLFDANRDIEVQSFFFAETLDNDWQSLAEEVRRRLDGYKGRIGIHGPFRGFTIHSVDPEIRRVVEKRMMQGLDVCDAINADHMVIHSPYTAWDHNNLDNIRGSRDKVIECTHETLRHVVERAGNQGVTLVIENITDINPTDRRVLAESFNSDQVKLSVDTGHAHYAHVATGAAPVDYFIEDAGAHLEHVHLQDADGYADRHWALGEGTILWDAVFRAIAKLDQKPRLVLELQDNTRIPFAMAYLTKRGLAR